MDRENAAGRRSHRRLIVALLALTLGATLGAAAPPALAVPKITLEVSPMVSSLSQIVTVTGDVYPVELVGEFVTLSVQKRSRSGEWTTVRSSRAQVKFTAPQSWQGKFNMQWMQPPDTAGSYIYAGQVAYALDSTDLNEHVAHYKLTSATGLFNNDCSITNFSSTSTWTPLSDEGDLWWYFAESKDGSRRIPVDSYDGSAQHYFTGVSTITWDGFTYVVDNATASAGASMWVPGEYGETKRPLAGFDWSTPGRSVGYMRNTPVRKDSTLGTTESLDWDLESSNGADPYPVRHGYCKVKYRCNEKGVFRLRATIPKTADHGAVKSPWMALKVKR